MEASRREAQVDLPRSASSTVYNGPYDRGSPPTVAVAPFGHSMPIPILALTAGTFSSHRSLRTFSNPTFPLAALAINCSSEKTSSLSANDFHIDPRATISAAWANVVWVRGEEWDGV